MSILSKDASLFTRSRMDHLVINLLNLTVVLQKRDRTIESGIGSTD